MAPTFPHLVPIWIHLVPQTWRYRRRRTCPLPVRTECSTRRRTLARRACCRAPSKRCPDRVMGTVPATRNLRSLGTGNLIDHRTPRTRTTVGLPYPAPELERIDDRTEDSREELKRNEFRIYFNLQSSTSAVVVKEYTLYWESTNEKSRKLLFHLEITLIAIHAMYSPLAASTATVEHIFASSSCVGCSCPCSCCSPCSSPEVESTEAMVVPAARVVEFGYDWVRSSETKRVEFHGSVK